MDLWVVKDRQFILRTLFSVPHDTLQLGLNIGEEDLGAELVVGRVGEVGASAGLTNCRESLTQVIQFISQVML
jgi:hypothetical protein